MTTEVTWASGCNVDQRISLRNVFLQMFPPAELSIILRETNNQRQQINKRLMTKGELLKFFGVVILVTKYKFTSRASLWITSPPSKYEACPNFGQTGMSHGRLDDIWRCIRFSTQPEQ
jgi:Transposase IS4